MHHRRRRRFPVHSRDNDSRFPRMMAASASARRIAGLPAASVARIGLFSLIAEE
jgi:hypothetical protein